jgi:hypothetical protein
VAARLRSPGAVLPLVKHCNHERDGGALGGRRLRRPRKPSWVARPASAEKREQGAWPRYGCGRKGGCDWRRNECGKSAAAGGAATGGKAAATGGAATGGKAAATGGVARWHGAATGVPTPQAAALAAPAPLRSAATRASFGKSANKTNYTSIPIRAVRSASNTTAVLGGTVRACDGTKPEAWFAAHDIVAAFPDFQSLRLHDLCLRKGQKVIVVTVLDTCGDSDCNGCCTRTRACGSAPRFLEATPMHAGVCRTDH